MSYLHFKALHLIFVVTWFAGLFYIVRLFIYATEANNEEASKRKILLGQFSIMQSRLWYGITWPSMILTVVFGGTLLYLNQGLLQADYMKIKLGFVGFLIIYHLLCHVIFRHIQQEKFRYSSMQLRIWNEVATLFLVSIIFLIVLRNTLDFGWAIVGLGVCSAVLMLAIRIYKKRRTP